MSVTGFDLQPLLFELSSPGRGGGQTPPPPPEALHGVPQSRRRLAPPILPELDELAVTRHFTNLSQLNHAVDTGFYPLGSCTMKHNPRLGEWAAALPGFAELHPLVPDALAQGTLEVLWRLQATLAEISGMYAVSLEPAAGAHGELTGILIVRAYHASRADEARSEIIVPDSAHGTNPATASMAGYRLVSIPSGRDGTLDFDAFLSALGPQTAAVMLTNPSTLGLFERRVGEIVEAAHGVGALCYMDGANLNAILGRFRPGASGFDLMHFNVHKTFATPHGGGGPGAGPVGVKRHLLPFLPYPLVLREPEGGYRLERQGERQLSIGRVRAHVGNVAVLIKAFAYILRQGADGLRQVSEDAVLAANYLMQRVSDSCDVPYPGPCKHEFVASAAAIKRETGIRTLDIAKRLIDFGFHPPTVYFPLIVDEALLIEPTETESLETLDAFADTLNEIMREAREEPELLHDAPHATPVRRLDEVAAARTPNLRWRPVTAATSEDGRS